VELPPGQRGVVGFPRYGVDLTRPPVPVPTDWAIEVTGDLTRRTTLPPSLLSDLPRRELVADFHCVAGWSARGLRWQGVPFATVYAASIEPALTATARVRYVVFVGLDGYRSILTVEDALADDVLLADRLDGEPLDPLHGAPVRLVSPSQYGYVNTKHLSRIELYAAEPVNLYHPRKSIQRALLMVRPHPRARVAWEERHRFLPGWLARRVYRRLGPLPAPLAEDP